MKLKLILILILAGLSASAQNGQTSRAKDTTLVSTTNPVTLSTRWWLAPNGYRIYWDFNSLATGSKYDRRITAREFRGVVDTLKDAIAAVPVPTASNGIIKVVNNFVLDTTVARTVNNSLSLAQSQSRFNTVNAAIAAIPNYTGSAGINKTGSNFTLDTTYARTVNNSLSLAQAQTKYNLYQPLSQKNTANGYQGVGSTPLTSTAIPFLDASGNLSMDPINGFNFNYDLAARIFYMPSFSSNTLVANIGGALTYNIADAQANSPNRLKNRNRSTIEISSSSTTAFQTQGFNFRYVNSNPTADGGNTHNPLSATLDFGNVAIPTPTYMGNGTVISSSAVVRANAKLYNLTMIEVNPGTFNATALVDNYYGLNVLLPSVNATNNYGINIGDGTGSTVNGLRLGVSAGTNKFNIYTNGTAPVYFMGKLGLSGQSTPVSNIDLIEYTMQANASLFAGTGYPVDGTNATGDFFGGNFNVGLASAGGSGTKSYRNIYGVRGIASTSQSTASLVNAYGGYFQAIQNSGSITNAYGVYVAQSGGATNKYAIYTESGAGNVGLGILPTAQLDLSASTTVRASLRVRSGATPTTPNDGDIWYIGNRLHHYSNATDNTVAYLPDINAATTTNEIKSYREITAATTILSTDYSINGTGTFTQALPNTAITGQIFVIMNSGSGIITVTAANISKQTSIALNEEDSITVQYTGTPGRYKLL